MNKPSPPQSPSLTQESSVLFSLNELMDLENDRIADEEAQREAERSARERAQEQQLLAQRRAELARLRAQEDERRAEELRRREESARLEAIQLAEMEKARSEAESEARLKMLALSQDHEQKLTLLREDKSKQRLRLLLVVSVAAACVVAFGGVLWVQETERQAEAARVALENEAGERKRAQDAEIASIANRMRDLGEADARARERMQARIDELLKAQAAEGEGRAALSPKPGPSKRTLRPDKASPSPRVCADGDPMCAELNLP